MASFAVHFRFLRLFGGALLCPATTADTESFLSKTPHQYFASIREQRVNLCPPAGCLLQRVLFAPDKQPCNLNESPCNCSTSDLDCCAGFFVCSNLYQHSIAVSRAVVPHVTSDRFWLKSSNVKQ